ncbi:dolichol kinase [Halobacteriales archaeon SW_7_68_16]|nr:MAG: dolichol kinase [Halobacteriales archaeon SW_7_68_16]
MDDDDHVDPEDESFRAELGRRVFHVSGAVVPVAWAVGAVGWRTVRWLCVAGAVAGLAVECARLVVGLDWAMFDRLTRGYEQDNLAGYALYLIGGAVAAWVYAPRVAAAALLMLTVADPVSGLAGSGELRRVKPLPILLVTFGTSLVLAAPLLPLRGAVPAAAGATVADGVKPIVRTYVVDDNLTIPLVAGAAGTIGLAV